MHKMFISTQILSLPHTKWKMWLTKHLHMEVQLLEMMRTWNLITSNLWLPIGYTKGSVVKGNFHAQHVGPVFLSRDMVVYCSQLFMHFKQSGWEKLNKSHLNGCVVMLMISRMHFNRFLYWWRVNNHSTLSVLRLQFIL